MELVAGVPVKSRKIAINVAFAGGGGVGGPAAGDGPGVAANASAFGS